MIRFIPTHRGDFLNLAFVRLIEVDKAHDMSKPPGPWVVNALVPKGDGTTAVYVLAFAQTEEIARDTARSIIAFAHQPQGA